MFIQFGRTASQGFEHNNYQTFQMKSEISATKTEDKDKMLSCVDVQELLSVVNIKRETVGAKSMIFICLAEDNMINSNGRKMEIFCILG